MVDIQIIYLQLEYDIKNKFTNLKVVLVYERLMRFMLLCRRVVSSNTYIETPIIITKPSSSHSYALLPLHLL